jgi:hypothetical protein
MSGRALLVIVLGLVPLGTGAVGQALDDAQAKAALLINVARFVQWPAPDEGALRLCVSGDERMATVLGNIVRSRNLDGRPLTLQQLRPGDDGTGCHVLYLAASRQRDDAETLRRTRGSVLTVGETVQFLRDGGMVRVYVEEQRIRFQINAKAAESVGIRIHAQLLSLAAR